METVAAQDALLKQASRALSLMAFQSALKQLMAYGEASSLAMDLHQAVSEETSLLITTVQRELSEWRIPVQNHVEMD
jgi:hypothetical protein